MHFLKILEWNQYSFQKEFVKKPKENDYVTLSYAWKLDDVNGRFAMQLHMGNSKHPELEKIVKDMCKFQKNIAKIPARVRMSYNHNV